MKFLIHKGADVNLTTSNGDTLFHIAIAKYDEPTCLDLVKMLIEAGCDPTIQNPKKTTFHVAIERRYASVVECLLSYNVPHPPDILAFALKRSTPQMVKVLIRGGIDVNSTMSNGDTVLHFAIANYDESTCLDLLDTFIEAGGDLAIRNFAGKTAIYVAIKLHSTSVAECLLSRNAPLPPDILAFALRRRSPPQMIRSLIRRGIDVNPTMSNRDTVLHLAIATYEESPCLDLVNVFIEAGCNPALCNSEGKAAFHVAIERQYPSVVGCLLSHNVPLPPGILAFALRRRPTPQMVKCLIRRGVDVNCTTPDGDTVLRLAIADFHDESACLDFVNVFIEAGCNLTTHNSTGETALHVAVQRGYTSVAECLLSRDVPLPPDILAFALRRWSTPQMVKCMIRRGVDVNYTTPDGDTVLCLAIAKFYDESACLDLVNVFIEAGCNLATHSSTGKTALHVAVRRGYTSVAECLLSRNVPLPPDILAFALQMRSTLRMVKFLIRRGVDVNYTMPDGDTILRLAIANFCDESACLDLVNVFIEAGYNFTTLGSAGKTALHVAIQRGYTSVAECLLSHNVPLPPDILVSALQSRSTPQMVRFLVHKGADVHSTMPNEDTLLHLAIATSSSRAHEQYVLEMVQILVDAGCNPMELGFRAETACEAAMKHGHILAVQYLLSCDIPLPPASDIVLKALELHCIPEIIQLLAHKYARDLAAMADLDWGWLLSPANAYDEPQRQEVLDILNAARQTNMTQLQ